MYSKYLCSVQTEIELRARTEEVGGKVLMCEDCSSAHWAENCVQLQTLHCSSTIYWVLLCGTIFLCVQLYSTIFLRFQLCSIAQYFCEFTLLYSTIYNTLLQLRYSPPYCSILYIYWESIYYTLKVLPISHCNIIIFLFDSFHKTCESKSACDTDFHRMHGTQLLTGVNYISIANLCCICLIIFNFSFYERPGSLSKFCFYGACRIE